MFAYINLLLALIQTCPSPVCCFRLGTGREYLFQRVLSRPPWPHPWTIFMSPIYKGFRHRSPRRSTAYSQPVSSSILSGGTSHTMLPKPGANSSSGAISLLDLHTHTVTKGHAWLTACRHTVAHPAAYADNHPFLPGCPAVDLSILLHHLSIIPADHKHPSVYTRISTSLFPAFFSSGVIISCSFATSTAKETRVGGTSNIIEGAGHGVLSADGRKAEAELCMVRAKQRCKRLAPAAWDPRSFAGNTPGR